MKSAKEKYIFLLEILEPNVRDLGKTWQKACYAVCKTLHFVRVCMWPVSAYFYILITKHCTLWHFKHAIKRSSSVRSAFNLSKYLTSF